MMNFFRSDKWDNFFEAMLYYVLGPFLLILFGYMVIDSPNRMFDVIQIRGRHETPLILGIFGLVLTISGIVKLIKKHSS